MRIAAGLSADDNYGLRRAFRNDVVGALARVGVNYQRHTERSDWQIDALVQDEYLSQPLDEENDYAKLTIKGARKYRRLELSGNLSFIRDTTLTDEALTSGPTTVNVERDRAAADLSLDMGISERQFSRVTLYHQALRFDEFSRELTEYDYNTAVVQYFYSLTELHRMYLSAAMDRVDYQDFEPRSLVFNGQLFFDNTQSTSASLGLRGSVSERLTYDVSVGYRQTDYEGQYVIRTLFGDVFVPYEEEGNGVVADVNLRYGGETSLGWIKLNRRLSPNSVGSVIEYRSLALGSEARLSKKFTVTGEILLRQQRSDLEQDTDDNLDNVYVIVGAEWALTPQLKLGGEYRYLERTYTSNNVDTESNRIQVSVTWLLDELQW
ncbi:MAG: hypothetical protein SV765_11890 [Pseudomonadota bacterium]|nr:hypothetical protein [Pseudomonadota bacterium]